MTITDIMLALAITSMVAGVSLGLVDPIRRAVRVQSETVEVLQRARSGFLRLETDLREAGVSRVVGDHSTGLPRAAVLPTRAIRTSDISTEVDAITILRVTDENPQVAIGSPLSSSVSSVRLAGGPGCLTAHLPCGFRPDMTVMIFDNQGRSDFLRVRSLGADAMTLSPLGEGHLPSYSTGSMLALAQIRTYYHDVSRAQLRYRSALGADLPVLDDVVGVTFRYFGHASFPLAGAAGVEHVPCLAGRARHRFDIRQVELTRRVMSDGPLCGGDAVFDLDLLRVRRVRVELRLQTSSPEHRGPDRRLFATPGDTVSPSGWVPDVIARFDVAIGNPWRP